jgi:hypothetical protein
MDPLDILKRAWNILWSYRALWVFALLLGLTAGGSSINLPNGNNFQNRIENNEDFSRSMQELQQLFRGELGPLQTDIPGNIWTTVMWVVLGIILLVLIVAIVFTIVRYISETAVIRMVDAHENTAGQPGVRAGFRLGWSRAAWRLFLINLLISLPIFLLMLFMLLVGLGLLLLTLQGAGVRAVPAWIGFGIVMMLVILITIVLSIVLNLFRQFFWRASALEGAGVGQAFRRGYDLVRRNWQNVGLMWLILVGIGIAWAVVMFVAFFLLIPVYFLTGAIGLVVGGIPALLVAGFVSLFQGGWIPWVLAAIIGLPLFFIVTFSPLIFLGGLGKVFTSTVWTLTYRELAVLESLAPPVELPPAAAPAD